MQTHPPLRTYSPIGESGPAGLVVGKLLIGGFEKSSMYGHDDSGPSRPLVCRMFWEFCESGELYEN